MLVVAVQLAPHEMLWEALRWARDRPVELRVRLGPLIMPNKVG